MNKEYWAKLQNHPLAPSESDADVFMRMLLPGSVLLLGCTRRLIPMSTSQLDIDPWFSGPNMVVGDWRDNRRRFDNIIGDGSLNLSKEICDGVLEMASGHCDILVARCFNRKLEGMMVATHFPGPQDFPIEPCTHLDLGEYSFYSWRFS